MEMVDRLQLSTEAQIYIVVGIQAALLLPIVALASMTGVFGSWIPTSLVVGWTTAMAGLLLLCGVLLYAHLMHDTSPITDWYENRLRSKRGAESARNRPVSDKWAEMEKMWEEGSGVESPEGEE